MANINGRKAQGNFTSLKADIAEYENLTTNDEPIPLALAERITGYLHWLDDFLTTRRDNHKVYNKRRNAIAKAAERLLSPDEREELERQVLEEIEREG